MASLTNSQGRGARGPSNLRDSTYGHERNASRTSSDDGVGHIAPAGAAGAGVGAAAASEKSPRWADGANGPSKSRKKLWWILGALLLLLGAGLAIGLGVG